MILININSGMPPKINLQKSLNHPLTEEDWPNLQSINKMMQQYLVKSSKNRQYSEAQKAKQKIEEVHYNIRKRTANFIKAKYQQNFTVLQQKQLEEKDNFITDWNYKIKTVQENLEKAYEKRARHHEEQIIKLREQLQLALPKSYSPDDTLKRMRYQQNQMAKENKFIEAQKIKEQIQERQKMLEQKHRKLREINIEEMMQETQQKQIRDLDERKKQKFFVMEEMSNEKQQRLKQMSDRHEKQMKELKWMYQEEIRMSGGQ